MDISNRDLAALIGVIVEWQGDFTSCTGMTRDAEEAQKRPGARPLATDRA